MQVVEKYEDLGLKLPQRRMHGGAPRLHGNQVVLCKWDMEDDDRVILLFPARQGDLRVSGTFDRKAFGHTCALNSVDSMQGTWLPLQGYCMFWEPIPRIYTDVHQPPGHWQAAKRFICTCHLQALPAVRCWGLGWLLQAARANRLCRRVVHAHVPPGFMLAS